MYSICYLIPYFGKLPKGFDLWLLSCEMNPTINWIILTDDTTPYNYPDNVKVKFCSFDSVKNRISEHFDFPVCIPKPWKLCDFKPTYGEIFSDELGEYDFWGHCDVDLLWGDIRKFITDDILSNYEKIGFQGHSCLYKNNAAVNSRYRVVGNSPNSDFKKVFSDGNGFCFDENGMCDIYDSLNIPYYRETNFAHLNKYEYGFFLGHLPKEDDYKNEHQIFLLDKGKIIRLYLSGKDIKSEEFMYIHFFCRPIRYKTTSVKITDSYIIYADSVENHTTQVIDSKYIRKHSRNSAVHYYISSFFYNRKKINCKTVFKNVVSMLRYKKRKRNTNKSN